MAELQLKEPTVASLTKAYDAMKSDGLVFANTDAKEEIRAEPAKKKASGSSLFGIGSSKPSKNVTLPTITPEMDGRTIMNLYKQAAEEQGIPAEDLLRQMQSR